MYGAGPGWIPGRRSSEQYLFRDLNSVVGTSIVLATEFMSRGSGTGSTEYRRLVLAEIPATANSTANLAF
jgi:hypothetical protein